MARLKLFLFCALLEFFVFADNASAYMFWNQACNIAGQTGAYISAANSATLNITQSFEIEMWIIPTDATEPPIQALLEKTTSAQNTGYTMFLSNGRVALRTNGVTRVVGSTVLQNNVWTHIAGVYDFNTSQFTVYVNGNPDGTASAAGAAPLPNNDSLRVGRSISGNYFTGRIDELRIWKKALTTAEIQKFMRTTLGAASGIYSTLSLSYTFQNRDAGSTFFSLKDWSGNGNDGNGGNVTPFGQSDRVSSTIALNDCVKLDGVNDFFFAADNADVSPTAGVTLEAWIYPLSTTSTRAIFHKGPAGGQGNYALRLVSGFLSGEINGLNVTSNVSIPTGRWTHVAFTYNSLNGNVNFHINGRFAFTTVLGAGSITNGTDNLNFGSNGTGQYFSGFLDEMRISNYVKTQAIVNRFLYESIDQSNQPLPGLVNVVYNLDGYALSNSDNGNAVTFVSDAGFAGVSAVDDSPVSPLNRSDLMKYDDGFMMKSSFLRAPSTGTTGTIADSFEVCLDTTISDLNLFLGLNHSAEEEIEVFLRSPTGQQVKVYDSQALLQRSDNIITIFDDQEDSLITNSGRYTGFGPSIRPLISLNAAFQGKRTAGFWKIIVTDQFGAGSGMLYSWGMQFNNAPSLNSNLCLRVFMEGFYRENDSCVTDTIDVRLRRSSSPYPVEVGVKGETPDDNYVFRYTFDSASIGTSYYLQVRHRNSIQIWSANPVTFDFLNGNLTYDFTLSADSAFGSNQVQVDSAPLRFAMYGGDVDQNNLVDITDLVLVDNDAAAFTSGYVDTDVTGDNYVDLDDLTITDNNASNFIQAITP